MCPSLTSIIIEIICHAVYSNEAENYSNGQYAKWAIELKWTNYLKSNRIQFLFFVLLTLERFFKA